MGIAAMNSRVHRLVWTGLLLQLGLSAPVALAQRAEPPLPNASGDFLSSQTQGNRGLYEVRHWLMVDRDPEGTHCRSLETHQPIARLFYGDLVVTDTPEHGLQQAVGRGAQPDPVALRHHLGLKARLEHLHHELSVPLDRLVIGILCPGRKPPKEPTPQDHHNLQETRKMAGHGSPNLTHYEAGIDTGHEAAPHFPRPRRTIQTV